MSSSRPILLIEDDDIDAMTFRRALNEMGCAHPCHVATDGEKALERMERAQENEPWLVFMDINLPRLNGFEVLATMRERRLLQGVPVLVLTTSSSEADIKKASDTGAAGYFVKPVDYADFVETLRAILQYWTLSRNVAREHRPKGIV